MRAKLGYFFGASIFWGMRQEVSLNYAVIPSEVEEPKSGVDMIYPKFNLAKPWAIYLGPSTLVRVTAVCWASTNFVVNTVSSSSLQSSKEWENYLPPEIRESGVLQSRELTSGTRQYANEQPQTTDHLNSWLFHNNQWPAS